MVNGALVSSLDTPAVLVDLDRLEANIGAMATMAAKAGLSLRPHTKVHRSPYISRLQIEAGAIGVSVSKLSEAEVYAKAGINDIMVVHPFVGEHKLATLKALVQRARISCVVDGVEGARGISQVATAVRAGIPVLLKVDTGCSRFGVPSGRPAVRMAKELSRIPGIELVGILSHECAYGEASAEAVARLAIECASAMSDTARLLREEGNPIKDVVLGATPTARPLCENISRFPEVTEIHPGAYVFGDWTYVNTFSMSEDDCAATVIVTVVSTPGPGRACVDGGAKTFGADPLLFMAGRAGGVDTWAPTYGSVKGRPDIRIERLSEEVGVLALTDQAKGVCIGDRLQILPNHVSLAVNLHDKMYGIRNGAVEREIPVSARGMDR